MEDHINTEIAQLAAPQEKRPAMPQREWSGFLREVYVSRKPPVTGTVDVKKLEKQEAKLRVRGILCLLP